MTAQAFYDTGYFLFGLGALIASFAALLAALALARGRKSH